MTATTAELNELQIVASEHRLVAQFIDKFGPELAKLTYSAMFEKMPDTKYSELPYIYVWTDARGVTMQVHGKNQRGTMRTIRRMIGGEWRKAGYGNTFAITSTYTQGSIAIDLEIRGAREEVCQRVVVGVEEIHHEEVKAAPARVEFRDKVDWVCGNLLED